MKKYLLFVAILGINTATNAQHVADSTENAAGHTHRFTIMMANAHIPNTQGEEDKDKFSVVPAWGLDYDFWLNKKWAIGLHSDLILQQYKIKKEDDHTIVERSYPVSMCAVGIFKPFGHLSFISGIGKEFEKHENFGMWKLGVEYGFELPKAWELSLNFQYDNKFKAYDTWLFGIGISKLIHSPGHK